MLGLGFVCISKSLKENGSFRTMSVKTYKSLKHEERMRSAWKGKRPKVHLSSGRNCPTDRHHADFIDYEDYKRTIELVKDDFDIMMECKEKDLAVLELIKKTSKQQD